MRAIFTDCSHSYFHKFLVNLQSVKKQNYNYMETSEILYRLDVERLSFLNSLISELYNFDVEGAVYSEDEQKEISALYQ